MLNIILIVIGVIIALVLLVASFRPSEFRVTRSATFRASPEKVFPYLNNRKLSKTWSPWFRLEPESHVGSEGPDEGVGSAVLWEGKKIGAGTMTVTESVPNKLVRVRLDFLKPFKATNSAEWTLMEQGNSTVMTWTMWGPANMISKLMGMFVNCEKMVGTQFEQGLKNLKEIVEK